MTPTLSAYLLQLPLPVRLALLDADPDGAGWHVWWDHDPRRIGAHSAQLSRPDRVARTAVEADAAWLPCNPLAIVEHAARLLRGDGSLLFGIGHDAGDYIAWVGSLVTPDRKCAESECPHTVAIKLLEEVLRD